MYIHTKAVAVPTSLKIQQKSSKPIIKAKCGDCLIIEFVLMCSKYIHTKAAGGAAHTAAAATSLNGVSLYHQ